MILVDTPGIGGSGNVTDKLIEYLPNALLFIFVINAGSAGGMQNDRVNIGNKFNFKLRKITILCSIRSYFFADVTRTEMKYRLNKGQVQFCKRSRYLNIIVPL